MKQKILLILTSIVLGLFISEIIARSYFYFQNKVNLDWNIKYKFDDRDSSTFRIGILGGSTSNGYPYDLVGVKLGFKPRRQEDFTLPSFTKIILENFYNYEDIIIDKYCDSGWTMQKTVESYFNKAMYKPDLLVILSGFNEITSYYSPNMKSVPFILLPLRNFKIGELFLRIFFIRPFKETDINYKGGFFSQKALPDFEKRWLYERYAKYLKILIKHCKKENIPLLVIIPDGNYTFPPTRNIFKGDITKKKRAQMMFREVVYYTYFNKNLLLAEKRLLSIKKFCEFADLYYELGNIYYIKNDYEKARDYFRKAIDIDGYSLSPSSTLRNICRTLAVNNRIPVIDMHNIVTDNMKFPIPDYSCYIDNAHLKLRTYFELNKEIINVIKGYNLLNFNNIVNNSSGRNRIKTDYTYDEALSRLYIPEDFEYRLSHNTYDWYNEQSNYFFLKYRLTLKMMELRKIIDKDNSSKLTDEEKQEKERILDWVGFE